jgi:CAAX prenyl protease-like protein
MTAPVRPPTNDVPAQQLRPPRVSDDVAYVLPMLAFLVLVWVGGTWKSLYAPAYVARALIVPVLLAVLWRQYTRIRWNGWWLGAIVGVVGVFQWVLMQRWIEAHLGHLPTLRPPAAEDVFNPFRDIHGSPAMVWTFIAIRVAGAALVVPVMEELFWRDYLWRQILAPNDFKLASVGEWAWAPFLGTSVFFCTVHGHWWPTAIVWALMVAGLLVYTKSLGACIVAHGVTNALLAVYVLKTHDWGFW